MNAAGRDNELWEAIADPTRRDVLDLLVSRGEATATALTMELPVSRQAVSKHLGILERVGLIEGHRQGREVRYRVRDQRLADATGAMAGVAARWDRRLRAIKRMAEDAAGLPR